MPIVEENLGSPFQTGKRMRWIIDQFNKDLDNIFTSDGRCLAGLSAQEMYDFTRLLPYKRDTKPVEVIARPSFIVKMAGVGVDCKKKSILLGCWAKRRGVPFRLVVMSSRPDKKFHHVFPQFRTDKGWTNFDATYRHYSVGMRKRKVTRAEVV